MEQGLIRFRRYLNCVFDSKQIPRQLWGDLAQDALELLLRRLGPERFRQLMEFLAVDLVGRVQQDRAELYRVIWTVASRGRRFRWPRQLRDRLAPVREQPTLEDARELLRLLPSQERPVMELSLVGWDRHQIARHLGLPVKTVSNYKSLALGRMREAARDDL